MSEYTSLEQDLDPYNLTRYEATGTVASMSPQQPLQSFTTTQWTTNTLTASTEFELSNRIINATSPLELNATQTITVQNNTGVFLNKEEEESWRGAVKLSDYPINVDNNPEVVHKTLNQTVNYTQPISIRYIKPPIPPRTGDILVRQDSDVLAPKAPPVIIRQRAREFPEPAPLVLREQPPLPPRELEKKCISISGKRLPPPPRRLVIEQMPVMPMRPQEIVIERWLPYEEQTRNVKFMRASQVSNWATEKNLIIKWDSPKVNVIKEIHTLPTVSGDPDEYRRLYGSTLLSVTQMNSTLKSLHIALPQSFQSVGVQRVARLEGDLEALKLVDLDRWGLSEYKYLFRESESSGELVFEDVWRQARVENGRITTDEAKRLITLAHQKLDKTIDQGRVSRFVTDVTNQDGWVEFEPFKKLMANWIMM